MKFRHLGLISGVSLLFLVVFIPTAVVFAAPIASVTLDVPATTRIGEAFTFEVTFDNTHPADVGYGPFIDLVFPVNGADGAGGTATPDGIDFISATYSGAPVAARTMTFTAQNACIDHPFLDGDTTPGGSQVCGTPGDKLVILELPFGSFVPSQPPVTVEINAILSNLADLGVPLNIRARGGFRFGANPVDDPCCDPPLAGTEVSAPVTPTLLTGEKENNAPEGEIATGPNNRRTWTITLDIADGQTITDLDVTDYLPSNVVVDATTLTTVPAGGVVTQSPPAGVPSNPPNNQLTVNFASVTGTAADNDIVMTFEFYIPYADANGNPVLNPNTGDDGSAENRFSAVGDWNPDDPRDGGGQDNATVNGECPTVCPGGNAPDLMAISGQKSGLTVPAGTPVRAGTVIEYTISFQVSDFFAFGNVIVTDTLADGLQFDAGFTPVLSLSGPMVSYSQAPGANGTTLLEFRITDEIGGPLVGGCIPAGGTGGAAPDCAAFNNGQALGTITYRAIVRDAFTVDFPSGDPSVDHGDQLTNEMSITGDLLDAGNITTSLGTDESDDSDETSTVNRGVPNKSIYAVNGVECGACTGIRLAAGDTITYRVRHEMPSSDYEDFSLTDYLPLPVFRAAEVTTFSNALDATIPPAGTAKLLVPGDTLHTLTGGFPTLTTDAAANTITFVYGDFDTPTNQQSFIDILFTVTMLAEPIADGLQLANQIQASEGSTNTTAEQDEAIVQVTATAPFLQMTKGVVATTNPNGQFIPANGGPVAFNPPGSPDPFNGVINSDGLTNLPINSDLTGVQQGDVITFAIVIENLGTSINGAFDIQISDILPPGFTIPPNATGLNLQIQLGSGQTISWVGLGTGDAADLFGPGIELIDPGIDTGVCGPFNGVAGTNIIIITYDLILSAPPGDVLTNTASVDNYSGGEGGGDFTGDEDLTDDATIGIGDTDITTGGGGGGAETGTGTGTGIGLSKIVDNPFAMPGESVTWTISVSNNTLAAATNFTVTDLMPEGVTVLRTSTTHGEMLASGDAYTTTIDLLLPGETARVTISAEIAETMRPPYIIINTATTSTGQSVQSTVISAQTMPETGEIPMRRNSFGQIGLLLAAVALMLLLAAVTSPAER